MWYGTLLLCIAVVWQTMATLASAIMLIERKKAPVQRMQPLKSLACNILVAINVCAVYVFLGLGGEKGLLGSDVWHCEGFGVWLLTTVPRIAWLTFLSHDFAFLLNASSARSTIRTISVCVAIVLALTSFVAVTVYDSASPQASSTNGCVFSASIERFLLGVTIAAWLVPFALAVLPVAETFEEVIHMRVTRMSGCDLSLLLSGWCSTNQIPRSFAELDLLTESRVELYESLSAPASPSATTSAHLLEMDSSIIEERMPASSASGILDSMPSLSPLLSMDNLGVVLLYDPRTRRVCVIAVALATLMFPFMVHTGQWSMHMAWRCVVFILYCMPLVYWQLWCTLRPAFYVVTRDSSYESAHRTLEDVQQMIIRAESMRYDYAADLKYYVETSQNAEHCDVQRVDLFLRTINERTKRDRFREFRLWVMCMQRREEPDAQRRCAMTQHIHEMFFHNAAPLYTEQDPALLTVLMASSYALEDPRHFDECIISLSYDLDQRTDRAEILADLKRRWEQQEENLLTLDAGAINRCSNSLRRVSFNESVPLN